MSDAHLTDALNKLVALGALNRNGANAFLAHRRALRDDLIKYWKAADELNKTDQPAADLVYRELKVITKALGWTLGVDFPPERPRPT